MICHIFIFLTFLIIYGIQFSLFLQSFFNKCLFNFWVKRIPFISSSLGFLPKVCNLLLACCGVILMCCWICRRMGFWWIPWLKKAINSTKGYCNFRCTKNFQSMKKSLVDKCGVGALLNFWIFFEFEFLFTSSNSTSREGLPI